MVSEHGFHSIYPISELCVRAVSLAPQQIEIKCFAMKADGDILAMAIIGYEAERQKIEEKIAEIKASLGGTS